MNIIFETLDFQDFTPQQLYAYMQLRSEVFVVEQNCVYQDLDGIDEFSKHVLVYQKEQLIACARIVPASVLYDTISIGRVIVAPSHRGKSLGHQLMTYCIEQIVSLFNSDKIVLSAQAHLQGFYAQHGFNAIGEGYLEDGIPHVKMLKEI
jgi:ElaA protein